MSVYIAVCVCVCVMLEYHTMSVYIAVCLYVIPQNLFAVNDLREIQKDFPKIIWM